MYLRGVPVRDIEDITEITSRTKSDWDLDLLRLPVHYWRKIRMKDPREPIVRAIRHRTRMVEAFTGGYLAVMLVAARLRHVASTKLGSGAIFRWMHCANPTKQEAAA
jgi:putative transposase